jgi:hypothetical protein
VYNWGFPLIVFEISYRYQRVSSLREQVIWRKSKRSPLSIMNDGILNSQIRSRVSNHVIPKRPLRLTMELKTRIRL